MRIPFFILIMASVLATSAPAQEQRASLEGVVTDASEAVLPGVTVEARSEAGAVATTVTDETGTYRFPSLAPGVYEVTANLSGFAPQKSSTIRLALGRVLRADFVLEPAGVTEEVAVTGDAPLIDVKQSARFQNIRDEYITLLPKGRDFTTLVTQAPGANDETRLGGLSIDGASAAENRYVIDGLETTSPLDGLSGKNLIADFVDEVQVKSSGYDAEYGGATGGVVNVLTKSGSNEFRGDASVYYTGSRLTSDAYYNANGTLVRTETLRRNPLDDSVAEYIEYPADSFSQTEPGFTLGGPLARDRAWFFLGYQPSIADRERTVTLLADNTTITQGQDEITQNTTANVTSQLGGKLRTRAAFNMSDRTTDGLLPSIDGSDGETWAYDVETRRPNYTLSGSGDYVVTPHLFVSARAGYHWSNAEEEGRPQGARYSFPSTTNIGLLDVPASHQRAAGFTSTAPNFETRRDVPTRVSFHADATYYGNFAGQHAIKGGVQMDRLRNEVDEGETGGRVQLFWDRDLDGERGTYGYYQVRSNGVRPREGFITFGDSSSNNVGLFIQDSWTVNSRLTLNLGLRTEREYVPSFSDDPSIPTRAIEFGFADKLAPRAGFALDVAGDGRTKVYGSWGLFYDIMKYTLPRGSFGGDKWLEYYYTLDTYEWPALVDSPDCPPACPGDLLRGPIDFRHPVNDPEDNLIDPDLRPYRLQEAVVGFEHELFPGISTIVRYVHKQVDVAIEDVGALDAQQNEIYTIGNPGRGQASEFFPEGSDTPIAQPKGVRDYDGVEFAVDRRLADNWALRVSYLWSRLHGNYSGLSQSDENGRVDPNVGRNFDYPIMSFGEDGQPVFGVLGTDRTHQFKTQFIYAFPFGTSAGVNQRVASGVPVTRQAAFVPPNNFPVFYAGRNSDGRTPVFSQTDLLLQHEIPLGARNRLVLMMDVQNLFNQDTATNRFATETDTGQGVNIDELTFFQGFSTQQLMDDQGIVRDPRFLMDSEFQPPRLIRFAARFTF